MLTMVSNRWGFRLHGFELQMKKMKLMIREYHRRHPNSRVLDVYEEAEELLKEEPHVEFSSVEGHGRYLDLHELNNEYINSKFAELNEKAKEPINTVHELMDLGKDILKESPSIKDAHYVVVGLGVEMCIRYKLLATSGSPLSSFISTGVPLYCVRFLAASVEVGVPHLASALLLLVPPVEMPHNPC
ncbi:hypothetical protein C5167_004394 [Papaver somniferum]|uniref:SF3A3 domain-containing protein n=1 Tax=Papaver somniferum TaxID=3469 RepID=A0A4Y7JAX1_PAPSO|nr:hypothetical protein C5167_004394 [Papaver somniferum]